MAEEQKAGERVGLSQLTLDNFDDSDEADSQEEHITARMVDVEARSSDNNKWTRVFARSDITNIQIAVHALGPDLIYDRAFRESAQKSDSVKGEVVFSPKLFKASDLNKELSECEISMSNLIGLGEIATLAKLRFSADSENAPAQATGDSVNQSEHDTHQRFSLNRRYTRSASTRSQLVTATEAYDMRETVGRKTIKKHQLSVEEIKEIVEAGKALKQTQKEIAAKFGVSP